MQGDSGLGKSIFMRALHERLSNVRDTQVQKGIGYQIYQKLESEAYMQNLDGILLETGRDTGWLTEWYLKLGFEIIGGNEIAKDVHTLFMLKRI